jgi:hypothetical protein
MNGCKENSILTDAQFGFIPKTENSSFSLTHIFSFEYIDLIKINRLPDIPHFNNFCHKI